MTSARDATAPPPNATVLALQRRVYSARCNYPLDCPFVIHRCAPTADLSRAKCWDVSALRPGRVDERYCGLQWDSSRFAAAFAGQTIMFIGDSMADQQWRSLMCLESSRLLPTAFVPHHGLVGTASVDAKSSRTRCAETVAGTRICHAKHWSLEPVLASAATFAGDPNATLVLSAFAHTPNVSESEMMTRVAQWKRAPSPRRATIVWRTRGYDHYGALGYRGRQERFRKQCSPVNDLQRERQREAAHGRKQAEQALIDAGVRVLDADTSTEAAHGAHPLVCASEDPSKGPQVSFHDCRHFCLPGPVDFWNTALLEAHVPPFDTAAFLHELQLRAAAAEEAKAAQAAAKEAARVTARMEEAARRRRVAQEAADAADRRRQASARHAEHLRALKRHRQLLEALCVGFFVTFGLGVLVGLAIWARRALSE